MLDLSDKDFKTAIIKILPWAITSTYETNKKVGSLNKEMEDTKKNQMEALELKNTVKKGEDRPQWAQQQNDKTEEIVNLKMGQ